MAGNIPEGVQLEGSIEQNVRKTPKLSIFTHTKQAALALIVSAGLGSAAMADDKKPTESIQVAQATTPTTQVAYKEFASEHVPAGLGKAIINEAVANNADPEWDIPAIEEGLEELANTGDIKRDSLGVILEFAPKKGLELPIVIAGLNAREKSRLAKEGTKIIQEILDALKGGT